jgi:tetratricopeptide (TPR) repeat protein
MEFNRWLNESIVCFLNFNDSELSRLLFSTKVIHVPAKPYLSGSLESVLNKGASKDFSEKSHLQNFLTEHILAVLKRPLNFKHLNSAYKSLIKLYQEDERGYDYLAVVQDYTKRLLKEGSKCGELGEVINSLRMFVSSCQVTRPFPYSQVVGLYFALNISFKTSFRMNNLQNVTSLLRIANSQFSRLPGIELFPKAQQVEFKYYEGRLYLYEQELQKAEECLEFAFRICDKNNYKNKRILLRYLIPVKAYKGVFPTQKLILKYKLKDLGELIFCLKQGNISGFDRVLTANQNKFIKQGIFIMLEGLKLLAFRNLFKRTAKILEISQVKIASLVTALSVAGVKSISFLEIECILVNLIDKKWLKGYISSGQKTLVLSRVDPFPKIAEI